MYSYKTKNKNSTDEITPVSMNLKHVIDNYPTLSIDSTTINYDGNLMI